MCGRTHDALEITIMDGINGPVYGVIWPNIIHQTQIDAAFVYEGANKENNENIEFLISYAKFCHVFCANLENASPVRQMRIQFYF